MKAMNRADDGKSCLVGDSEKNFLWELEAARESVLRMEAKGGRPNRVLTDTRKKVAFLETFVESINDAANDCVRLKPEYRSLAGRLLADAEFEYPHAQTPILGARAT